MILDLFWLLPVSLVEQDDEVVGLVLDFVFARESSTIELIDFGN